VLEKELDAYNSELLGRRYVILLNKIDLVDRERLQEVQDLFSRQDLETVAISAETGQGIDQLKEMLAELFEETGEKGQ
jgi:GTP-binding protein